MSRNSIITVVVINISDFKVCNVTCGIRAVSSSQFQLIWRTRSNSPHMPPGKSSVAQSSDMDFCGIGRSVRAARQRRRRKQPWVIRKIWILVTFGIIGYTGYVYIARLCLPMIKRKMWAPASQTTGSMLILAFM